MASVADIQTSIWEDLEGLTDDAILLYVWAFSNTNINPAGLYKIARRNLAAGRLTPGRLDTALQELEAERLLYYRDGVVWIRTHVKHYRTKSEQTAKSVVASLRRLTGHPLAAALYTEYRDLPGFPALVTRLQELADEGLVSLTPGSPKAQAPAASLRVVERKQPTARTVKHNSKVVPAETVALAEAILVSFNDQARTKYGAYTAAGAPSSNLSRILTAIIAHPEIDQAMGAAMIRNQLASPYWTGPPDSGNVFGGNALEKNLEAARRGGPDDKALMRKALR